MYARLLTILFLLLVALSGCRDSSFTFVNCYLGKGKVEEVFADQCHLAQKVTIQHLEEKLEDCQKTAVQPQSPAVPTTATDDDPDSSKPKTEPSFGEDTAVPSWKALCTMPEWVCEREAEFQKLYSDRYAFSRQFGWGTGKLTRDGKKVKFTWHLWSNTDSRLTMEVSTPLTPSEMVLFFRICLQASTDNVRECSSVVEEPYGASIYIPHNFSLDEDDLVTKSWDGDGQLIVDHVLAFIRGQVPFITKIEQKGTLL